MKKILLTLALAAFAFTANAQFVIGGNIGMNHNGQHDDNYTPGSNASTTITVMPKIGYWLNDDMQIGANLGWAYTYNRNYGGASDTYRSTPSSIIEFTPYLRYNVFKGSKFTFFCEAAVGISIHPKTTTHNFVAGNETKAENADNWTRFGLNVIPGINYAFNEHFSMDLYVNLLGLHAWMRNGDGWTDHDYGFNAEAGAQSLNAQFNNFMLGFNYAL